MTNEQSGQRQMGLRIFPAIVFIDWYGTLSRTKFWQSIIDNRKHPLYKRFAEPVERLFIEDKEFVRAWMRGLVDDAEVVDRMRVTLPQTYRPDFIRRRLLEDVRSSSVDERMIGIVTQLRQNAYIVVASDNMQCFSEAQPAVLSGELSIDELIVSSDVGALKAEDPHRFFAGSLERFCMNVKDAILIDDCPDTCRIFENWGGTAFHFSSVDDLIRQFNLRAPHGLQIGPDCSPEHANGLFPNIDSSGHLENSNNSLGHSRAASPRVG